MTFTGAGPASGPRTLLKLCPELAGFKLPAPPLLARLPAPELLRTELLLPT